MSKYHVACFGLCRVYIASIGARALLTCWLTCSLDIAERLNCTHSISTLFLWREPSPRYVRPLQVIQAYNEHLVTTILTRLITHDQVAALVMLPFLFDNSCVAECRAKAKDLGFV